MSKARGLGRSSHFPLSFLPRGARRRPRPVTNGFVPRLPGGTARKKLLLSTALAGMLAIAAGVQADPIAACGDPSGGTVVCTSAGNSYPGGVAYDVPHDLTVVIQNDVVMAPVAGTDGVRVETWDYGSSATVTAVSDASVTVEDGSGVVAIALEGDSTVVSNMDITVTGATSTGGYGAFAIGGEQGIGAIGRTVAVNSAGTISIEGHSVAGIGAYGTSSIDVTSTGAVVASGDRAVGIGAISGYGRRIEVAGPMERSINIEAADVSVSGEQIAFGIVALGGNEVDITAESIEAVADPGGTGAGVFVLSSGNVRVDIGSVDTVNAAGIGVMAYGSVEIDAGSVTTTGEGEGFLPTLFGGIDVNARAGIDIDVGTVSTEGDRAWGIRAESAEGDVDVTAGSVSATGDHAGGILADTIGSARVYAGSVSTEGEGSEGIKVDAEGDIGIFFGSVQTSGRYSAGIDANSLWGEVHIEGDSVVTAGDDATGIRAIAYTGVLVDVGSVATAGGNAAGIDVFSNDGAVILADSVTTAGDGSMGIIVDARGRGEGGDILVGFGAVATEGEGSTGIRVRHWEGTASIEGDSVTTAGSLASGISVESEFGDILVDVGSVVTEGEGSRGIDLLTGIGDIEVEVGTVETAGHGAHGVYARSNHGDVVVSGEDVIASGDMSAGLAARAFGGDAAVVGGDVRAYGNFSAALVAYATEGEAGVMVAERALATGEGSFGLFAHSVEGDAVVYVADGAEVRGGTGAGAGVWIDGSEGGALYNAGTISAANDRAVVGGDGGTDMLNTGTITGSFHMGAGDDTVVNLGTVNLAINSHFGEGDNTFYNYGRVALVAPQQHDPIVIEANIVMAAPGPAAGGRHVTISGLGTFDNSSGTISMVDGKAGDSLSLPDSDFVGGGTLEVDVNGSNGRADRLVIGGDVSGDPTTIRVSTVNDGRFRTQRFDVVEVGGDTQQGDFVLAGSRAGFFDYDLRLTDANVWQLGMEGAQQAFELPSLMTAQQDTWHRTAGLWRDRTIELRDGQANGTGVEPAAGAGTEAGTGAGRLGNVWLKALGDFSKRDADNEVEYKQHVYSLQAGADHEYALDEHTTLVAGLLGGYVRSDLDFDGTSADATFEGGTLGSYVSVLRGPLHIDLLLKADILGLDYNGGRPGTKGDTNTLAVGGAVDVGYRIDLGRNLFLEPNARLGYVRSSIGDEDFGDTSVEWKDGDNLRGELGMRIGATHVTGGGLQLQPWAEAGLLHDFTGENVTDVGGLEVRDDAGGEVRGKLGAGLTIGGTGGLSGFIGGDAHVGNDIQGGAVKGGVTWRF